MPVTAATASSSADLLLQEGPGDSFPPLSVGEGAACCWVRARLAAAQLQRSRAAVTSPRCARDLGCPCTNTWFAGSRGCACMQGSGTVGLHRGAQLHPALSGEMVLGAGLSVRQGCKASSSLESACGGGILQMKGESEGEARCPLRELFLRGAEPCANAPAWCRAVPPVGVCTGLLATSCNERLLYEHMELTGFPGSS